MNRDDYKKLWDKVIHFVDEFRRNPKPESLQEVNDLSTIEGAFYAGVVEFLAKEHNIPVPEWVFDKKYYLSEPLFPNGLKGDSRIYTALESPLAFKTRNIYIGANTFNRC